MPRALPALAAPTGTAAQPISGVQWLPREALSANAWNPNRQAPPEYRLLIISILENGWTQPIVARAEPAGLEIVDGFHRWTVAEDPRVAALTGGLVPVVILPECDPAVARLATIRHNRARGTHHVLGMADVVIELLGLGMTAAEVGARLEMDPEEVERLTDRGNMRARHGSGGFGEGWEP
jgi:ParB-like chromosome segregation protein Spo0J